MSRQTYVSSNTRRSGGVPVRTWGVPYAHQGGWDEVLFVVGPLAVFGFLLWRAARRADDERNDGG